MRAWFLQYWKLFVGAVALIWPAKDAILSILDWRGRYDAAIQTYDALGGWNAMIGFILSPPPWLPFLSALVGVALIYWHVKVWKSSVSVTPKNAFILAEHNLSAAASTKDKKIIMGIIDAPEDNVTGGFYYETIINPSIQHQGNELLRFDTELRLTNYSKGTIFGIEITFVIQFRESITQNENLKVSGKTVMIRRWPIKIAKIEPGEEKAFVFYVRNNSHHFATVVIPELAHIEADAKINVNIKAYPSNSFVLSPI